jgi:Domain of unknown function (DUF4190)
VSIASEQTMPPRLTEAAMAPERPTPVVAEPRTSRKAVWALGCGIAGVIVLPVLFSTVAICLGVVANNEISRDPGLGGQGKAIAGIVLGVIGLLFAVVFVVGTLVSS